MKKFYKLTALIGLAFALVCASCSFNASNSSSMGALKSIKLVDGFTTVYTAEFEGDYFLDDTIAANLKTSTQLLDYLKSHVRKWKSEENSSELTINVEGAACSSIVAKHKDSSVGGYIYGRNFDWDAGTSLILHTKPTNGYESVSTCYLGFLSKRGKADWKLNNNTSNNLLALECVYVPMDGLNEKGLYIACLQSDTDPVMPAAGDKSKNYVQTTVAIRYILDRAKNCDEAVAWLNSINMCPVYSQYKDMPDYHFAIADNEGKSIVVEWSNGELKVVESPVVTNHHLYNPVEEDNNSYSRFNTLTNRGENANWEMDVKDVTEVLEDVIQSHSLWSAIFEPSAKRATYYFRKADVFEGVTIPKDTHDHDDPNYDAYSHAKKHPIDYTKAIVVQF